jgi:hypothetical protein
MRVARLASACDASDAFLATVQQEISGGPQRLKCLPRHGRCTVIGQYGRKRTRGRENPGCKPEPRDARSNTKP